MEHAKHTPGPWTAKGEHVYKLRTATVPNGKDERGNRLYKEEQKAHGIPVVRVMFANEPDGAANARLIAAAPDLLALAQKVAALNPNAGEVGPGMLAHLVELARSVTALATGNPQP